MRYAFILLIGLSLAGCATGDKPHDEPGFSAADGEQPPPVYTVEGASVPWSETVVRGKRTVIVFMTPW